eukprot:7019875-Lingulodinium_polyedra.AAC.1
MHVNLGHPANEDLARYVRTAGGNEAAVRCVKALRCSTCARWSLPKLPRPSRLKVEDLEFNENVLADLFKVHDAKGRSYWFILVVDDAVGYCTVTPVKAHDPQTLFDAYEMGWLAWAGPPDRLVSDNERGLVSAEFVRKLAHSGTLCDPTAPRAPWQKGKVERKIHHAKGVIEKVVTAGQ